MSKQTGARGTDRLGSVAAVQLLGKSFRWDLPVTLLKGKIAEVELTNVNAVVATIVAPKSAARELAPEIAIYERLKRAVVRVVAGLGSGRGFLILTRGGL